MADDGDGRSAAADTSGEQGTTEDLDAGAGLGISGMMLNLSVLVLVMAACYVLYARWWRRAGEDAGRGSEASPLPKMRRRDFTLQQLREYDGVQNPRILMAVNTKVFDVTSGKKFYGRGKELMLTLTPTFSGCFQLKQWRRYKYPVNKSLINLEFILVTIGIVNTKHVFVQVY